MFVGEEIWLAATIAGVIFRPNGHGVCLFLPTLNLAPNLTIREPQKATTQRPKQDEQQT